jgi:preprotein translocase subunit SecA
MKAGVLSEDESLWSPNNITVVHHVNAALRAHALFQRDVDYIVTDGEVVIVDEFTGRTLKGRRWSDGLHQAVEAKEGVPIQRENQTLASITFQNFFRMYGKLAGMTGTADTEAYEFQQIYGLECVVIPTHRPMIRRDNTDLVFLNRDDKFKAILEDIRERQKKGQPTLVGTTSVETSELIANLLKKERITHEVLNAKQHEREAHIVAQAGRPGSVTIATNMAGRGTDIVLGGNPESEIAALGPDATPEQKAAIKVEWKARHERVLQAGGLHIIGTERHESRRIDNQLRGRSGRQGDPGSSRFYLSFEDNLLRIFGNMAATMQRFGMKPGESIEHRIVNRAIENAQRKVESHNFDIRKHLLDFDDVANDQRKVIYEQRNELMDNPDIGSLIKRLRHDVVVAEVRKFVPQNSIDEQWDLASLERAFQDDFGVSMPARDWVKNDPDLDADGVAEKAQTETDAFFAAKEQQISPEVMRQAEKTIMLNVLDSQWKDHLARMDYLRQGIHLRGYAQKQPKQEFKREAFQMFEEMLDQLKGEVITILAKIRVRSEQEIAEMESAQRRVQPMKMQHDEMGSFTGAGSISAADNPDSAAVLAAAQMGVGTIRNDEPKVGRNDPCPCGSGKKFKHCHGQVA